MSDNIHETPERIDKEFADRQRIAAQAADKQADQPPPAPPRRTITNIHNLPQALYEAFCGGDRARDDSVLHVTTLVAPIRVSILSERHEGEIVEDVLDRFFRVRGQAMHEIMAMIPNKPKRYTEWTATSELIQGIRVTGTIDMIEDDALYDYKFASVWSVVFEPEGAPHYRAQVNVYRWLLREMMPIRQLRLVYLFNDWSANKAKAGGNYPSKAAAVIDVPMWTDEIASEYVNRRVSQYLAARALPDNELPLCTPEERWRTADRYALMKHGRKSAIKLYDSAKEADAACVAAGEDKHYVEVRKGQDRRCIGKYCAVRHFCDFGLKAMAEQGGQDDDGTE